MLVGIVGRGLYEWVTISSDPSLIVAGDKENILPFMAVTLLPSFFAGIFIAMVLSAIMSTIDSLLVVASSAAVRDYWQKTRHPDMPDDKLVKLSQLVTLALALVAFAIGIGILLWDKDTPLFWIVIFGWSGIAATFCPTVILSLFWSRLTALGAKCSMVAGFAAVPLLKFAAPPILEAANLSTANDYLSALDVLPPAFAVSFVVAIVVSLLDRKGQARVQDAAAADLADCAGPPPSAEG